MYKIYCKNVIKIDDDIFIWISCIKMRLNKVIKILMDTYVHGKSTYILTYVHTYIHKYKLYLL